MTRSIVLLRALESSGANVTTQVDPFLSAGFTVAGLTANASATNGGARYWHITKVAAGEGSAIPASPGMNCYELIDPATPVSPYTLVYTDECQGGITANGRVAFGFVDRVIAATFATLTGIGFRYGPTGKWEAFATEASAGYTAPTTDLVAVESTVAVDSFAAPAFSHHRFCIIIDGPTKTVTWLIDGVVITTWTPATTPNELWGTLAGWPRWLLLNPGAGDSSEFRLFAGGSPNLVTLLWGDGAIV